MMGEDSLETYPDVNKRDLRRDKLYIMSITGSINTSDIFRQNCVVYLIFFVELPSSFL